jgi:hypothetical protein
MSAGIFLFGAKSLRGNSYVLRRENGAARQSSGTNQRCHDSSYHSPQP